MTATSPDLGRLLAVLDRPEARAYGEPHVGTLRAALREAVIEDEQGARLIRQGQRGLGRVLPCGTAVLYVPSASRPLRHRLLEVDRHGHIVVAVRRGPEAEFQGAWVRNVDAASIGVLPGGADHPLWGASDRIARFETPDRPALLTVSGAVEWDAIAAIPPLADPTRLPPGAGTSLLNLLASLAADQEAGRLRYRGPYPSEQLFWALLESFRVEGSGSTPNLLAAFTETVESQFAAGEPREAPLDWTAAPHERLFFLDEPDPIYVQLRDGVEKVFWEGRLYYRADWQGLRRREHRVVRPVETPGGDLRFVASLEAFGRPLEDHLAFDATGTLVERYSKGSDGGPERDLALAAPWREALAALLPFEATPLLATAIAAVWPMFSVVWGRVSRDLIEARGTTLRLSVGLVRAYEVERAARSAAACRTLAQRLVREVLGLIGPSVRRRAAAWLEAESPARQQALLETGARRDPAAAAARAALALGRLLEALEAGEALPL